MSSLMGRFVRSTLSYLPPFYFHLFPFPIVYVLVHVLVCILHCVHLCLLLCVMYSDVSTALCTAPCTAHCAALWIRPLLLSELLTYLSVLSSQ